MRRIRSKLSYANVVATLCLFVALGGTSYAAVKITGTFTVMLALGDWAAADRVYAGVALLTTGIFSGFDEPVKLLSPEYVAITATDGAGKVVAVHEA